MISILSGMHGECGKKGSQSSVSHNDYLTLVTLILSVEILLLHLSATHHNSSQTTIQVKLVSLHVILRSSKTS